MDSPPFAFVLWFLDPSRITAATTCRNSWHGDGASGEEL
jgi:hypothetical protein